MVFIWAVPTMSNACPSLDSFLNSSSPDWAELLSELEPLFGDCLQSSQYFALLGAAQLNLGELQPAKESLERSLLLDPDNGAALVDFSQALFEDGQLFAALELGLLIMDRTDVPETLRVQVVERQRSWERLTRQTSFSFDIGGGYDDNLNGAPNVSSISLTLLGEPIYLALSEDYRSVAGSLFSGGAAASHTWLHPGFQQTFTAQARARLSEDRVSDLTQLSSNYSLLFGDVGTDHRLELGFSHLGFSGNSLFSGVNIRYRLGLPSTAGSCERYMGSDLQHQTWHTQRRLDGTELKVSAGTLCNFSWAENQLFGFEASLLTNREREEGRLGGNRVGWQVRGQWQRVFGEAILSAQADVTFIKDNDGYSFLLENNARRGVRRESINFQYRRPWQLSDIDADFFINLFYQDQGSNLDLFRTSDTSLEAGVRIRI